MTKNLSVQTEVDASYIYGQIALASTDKNMAHIFEQMSSIEMSHALAMQKNLKNKGVDITLPGPSLRAKILAKLGSVFGYQHIIGQMIDVEKKLAREQMRAKQKHNIPLSGSEENHVTILENLVKNNKLPTGADIGSAEGKHKSISGNALRAAVLGANDGLLSNMSLVMGVAGATSGDGVLIAGLAGMLAGALSMGLGEWISVRSSQEMYELQIDIEMEELENNPEGEKRELVLIYMSKGIEEDEAHRLADEVIQNKPLAHEILVKEELGINTDELKSSAWVAAGASFSLFMVGAIVPVLSFFWLEGYSAIIVSMIASAVGLFVIGAAITLFTGKGFLYSGLRQVVFGLAASGITYSIGMLLGVSLT